ncbi:hypothetical protein PSEUDO8AS_40365 [Pseudomonas sp. 8AS]|nr:hypothetical protein PSEUDO8AS_40365 [Pseudomonas sp. 8AS]
MVIMRPVLRRGGRVAEGAPLLREYTSKGCRGFESPLLRHYLVLQALMLDVYSASVTCTHSSAG